MRTNEIADIPSLIEELGGLTAAARFFNESPQAVGNWRIRRQIPSRLFLGHREALTKKGIKTSVTLWGFDEQKPRPTPDTEQAA